MKTTVPILAFVAALGACAHPEPPVVAPPPPEPAPPAVAPAPPPAHPAAVASAAPTTPQPAPPPDLRPLDIPFKQLVESLSENDAYYFSHNYVSNESSYLQVAPDLPKRARQGGSFIGVGPEQNFTYIALTRPDIAFVVDIRRRNMLLHLLYKAIFEEASSRSHFLALLLARPYEAASAPPAEASIEDVIAHATKQGTSREGFESIHAKLLARIVDQYKIELSLMDRIALKESHKEFRDKQLDIRFELHVKTREDYPTLHKLLTTRDPSGAQSCFLASEAPFRLLQRMERENRIVPVVGDFAGDKAILGIARFMTEHDIPLNTFYASNVEEYLINGHKWTQWTRNTDAFPIHDQSLFLRSYLSRRGREPHPLQMQGHRAATFLQLVKDFRERQASEPFTKWKDVATYRVLSAEGG
jgi:hypothetical protein